MAIVGAFMVPHPPLIIPDVGRGREAQIDKTIQAYREAARRIAALRPETVIISSPHTVMYSDYFHISPGKGAKGSFADYGAPRAAFAERYDRDLRDVICRMAEERDFPAGTLGERDPSLDHGTMIPLHFVEQEYTGFEILRVGLSGLPLTMHYTLGMIIRDAAEETGRRAVFVASGDLSHKLQDYGPYGFAPEGPEYDERIMDVCGRAAFGELFGFDENFCDKAAECGHRSFVMMAGALDGCAVKAEKLSHEDVTGVGYGVCCYEVTGEDGGRHFLAQYLARENERIKAQRSKEDPLVRLARHSVESWIKEGRRIPVPDWATPEMTGGRAGVFVSLHEHGRLRGCIGTILPVTDSVAEEIIDNAVSACSKDPRFDPVLPEELPYLEISVDVLTTPERISGPEELDVKRYGVIVESGGRRGLLLPDLDGVDTVEEQIDIARRKGGIPENAKLSLKRFEVIRHH